LYVYVTCSKLLLIAVSRRVEKASLCFSIMCDHFPKFVN
jgi:hypothetical protein